MSNPTTTKGPWRVLIFSVDPDDPAWLLATVAPGDVRPASPAGLFRDRATVVAWARDRHGLGPSTHLTAMRGALCWRLEDESGGAALSPADAWQLAGFLRAAAALSRGELLALAARLELQADERR
jgi:hypothetical protein